MGNNESIITNKLDQLYKLSSVLEKKYKTEFLNEGFCKNISLIYKNKLMQWQKIELNGQALKLGIIVDKKDSKQKICDAIALHYQNRLTLISIIKISIEYSINRMNGLIKGPRCDGNPEIFDIDKCVKSKGNWVNVVVPPDREVNPDWYKIYDELELEIMNSLNILIDVLEKLERTIDINDSILENYG